MEIVCFVLSLMMDICMPVISLIILILYKSLEERLEGDKIK
jgi:hypothetical protein